MNLKHLDNQQKDELTMLEVAKAVLDEHEEVMHFDDILSTVSEYLEYSDPEIEEYMTQFYTDLNTEGSFISLGDNQWGLRSWYPVDSINEEVFGKNSDDDVVPSIAPDGFDSYITEDEAASLPDDTFTNEPKIEEEDEKDQEELEEYEEDLSELNIVDEDELESEEMTDLDDEEYDDDQEIDEEEED